MKTLPPLLAAAAFFAALGQLPASAQLITYSITGATSQPPTIDDPSTTATNLTFGSGFVYGGSSVQGQVNVYGAITSGAPGGPFYPTTLAGSISQQTYYTFTIEPVTGDLDLSAIDLSMTQLVSENRTRDFTLESSLTGFGTASGNILATDASFVSKGQYVPLTNSAFADVTSPVEFRIYIDDSPDGSTGNYESVALGGTINVDGFAFTPTPDIPEPSTYVLTGLGVALLVGASRNRRLAKI